MLQASHACIRTILGGTSMGPRLRKMKPYYPRRRRSKNVELNKQALRDLEHKISREVSSLILLIEEGNPQQIEAAKGKAKSDYMKHSDEMQKLAQQMGDRYSKAVRDFLDSVDVIVHSSSAWVDEAKVRNCYNMTQKLEKELSAA